MNVPEESLPISPLRAARIARGFSLRDMAHHSGIDAGHLSKVERGEKQLSVDALYRLAVLLELEQLASALKPCVSGLGSAEELGVPGDELTHIDQLQPWSAAQGAGPVTAAVVTVLRALRQEQKVSARELAERMTAVGYPIKRSVIANVESGRREAVSVDYLAAAAQALNADAATILRGVTVPCPRCEGAPPAGFICRTCGAAGGEA